MNRGMEWMERGEGKAGMRQRWFTASSPTVVSVPANNYCPIPCAPKDRNGSDPTGLWPACGNLCPRESPPVCICISLDYWAGY